MTYRFGIIGAGFISNRFTGVLRQNPKAQIVAVTDLCLEKAKDFAERHQIPRACTSEEFWEQDMDIVYIGLPNHAHVPMAKEALSRGIHVLCEKPMAMTEKDAVELAESAGKANRLLMEGMWTRCLPVYRKIREWIEADRIGEVRLIDSSFSGNTPFDPESRLYRKDLGGGSMFDIGVYCIEFATGLLGKPIDICGQAVIGKSGVDEQALISLQFENGAIAYSSCGFQAKTITDARIYGTKGSIWVDDFYRSPLCVLYDNDQKQVERFTDSFEDGFQYEIEHVISLLEAGKTESDLNPLADTIAVAQIYDCLRKRWNIL